MHDNQSMDYQDELLEEKLKYVFSYSIDGVTILTEQQTQEIHLIY